MRKGAGLAACLPLWMLTSWPAGHIYISVEEKKNGQEINKSFLNARKKKVASILVLSGTKLTWLFAL